MASELRVNTINSRSGLGTITVSDTGAVFTGITTIGSVTVGGGTVTGNLTGNVTGNLTGTASTATASATAYGLSGSPTLTGITSVSTTNLTVNGNAYPSSGPLSNRNLIINGAMQVAQRGTQVTGATTQAYNTCDRFELNISSLGTWTVDQDTNAPNGFSNSFKLTCTTADASPAAGDYLIFQQKIEGQNLQSLSFGTANAQATILSFWVRSNKTGNASIAVRQPDNSNKQVTYQYSVSSADTWEYKTIAIPADTSGVINNDNGEGLRIEWWLNSGSSFTGGSHQSTWTTADNTDRNASNFGLGGATSDYWQITGVQLEVGSVATPFEHRSFEQELTLCRRYYQSNFVYGEAIAANSTYIASFNPGRLSSGPRGYVDYYQPMRATPSITFWNNHRNIAGGDNNLVYNQTGSWASTTANTTINACGFQYSPLAGSAGDTYYFNWEASAEL